MNCLSVEQVIPGETAQGRQPHVNEAYPLPGVIGNAIMRRLRFSG
jgi:hypothetical protein